MSKIFLLVSLLFIGSTVKATERFVCDGNILVLGNHNKGLAILNKNGGAFSFLKSTNSLALTLDGEKSFVKIFPWWGIHYVDLKKETKASESFSVQTNGETWFHVVAQKPTSRTASFLSCKISGE